MSVSDNVLYDDDQLCHYDLSLCVQWQHHNGLQYRVDDRGAYTQSM